MSLLSAPSVDRIRRLNNKAHGEAFQEFISDFLDLAQGSVALPLANEAAIKAVAAADRSDGMAVIDLTNSVWWVFDSGSAAGASAWVLVPDAGSGRWLRQDPSLADLASTTAAYGASLIGINDTGSLITATTVEAALQELRTTLRVKGNTTLTIATGAVTPTQSFHLIDTEAAAASDDLDTFSAPAAGFYLVKLANAARNVVLKSGTGNIFCPYGYDITLDAITDTALIFADGTNAFVIHANLAATGGGLLGAALASSAASKGASLIGIEDAGGSYTATTVEAALTEIATDNAALVSGQATILNGATSVTVAVGAGYNGKKAVACFAEQPTAAGVKWLSADDVAGGNLVLRINVDNTANLKVNWWLDGRP